MKSCTQRFVTSSGKPAVLSKWLGITSSRCGGISGSSSMVSNSQYRNMYSTSSAMCYGTRCLDTQSSPNNVLSSSLSYQQRGNCFGNNFIKTNNNNTFCLWSNKIASYHTSMKFHDASSNPSSPPTSEETAPDQNQRIKEAKKIIEERMRKSSTATSLLTPMNANSMMNMVKDKSVAIVKAIPSFSWKVTVFTFNTLKTLILRPSVVKDWYARAKEVTVSEFKHYVAGSKLLVSDIKYAFSLTTKVLRGNALSRRERNQLLRTVSDIFRLVPFVIIVAVPFMEFTLPILLKLFPNMLPSQFEDGLKKKEKLLKEVKAKVELAKFLQDTVELMVQDLRASESVETVEQSEELHNFIQKIRNGESCSNDDIVKFAKLFKDEITLDHMSRAQLVAMCKYMGITPYGSDAILRYRLRSKLRRIKADDRLIYWEGVNSLSTEELMYACKERGMKIGVSKKELQKQLREWIELSFDKNIPSSLLIISRAFVFNDKLQSEEAIKMALGSLSDEVVEEVGLHTSSTQDYEKKLASLKRNEKLIKTEEEEKKKVALKEEIVAVATLAAAGEALSTATEAPTTVTEPKVSLDPEFEKEEVKKAKEEKIRILNEILATLASRSSVEPEREELEDLISDHIDLVDQTKQDQEQPVASVSRLSNRVGRLIEQIEKDIDKVDESIADSLNLLDKDKDGVITVDELRHALSVLKEKPSEDLIREIIDRIDADKDGVITVKDILLEFKQGKLVN
ncbi:hypothetical protein C9374_006144 [Naegleria lovaniensis]|uniref:Mitochondrial proton/calcium exchanger protein n=1 Tax=Naegleria lovaniensis TaxID=51637 RepID=A0AA88GKD0_NAELO|nr:uncharacterized protein C9374_006144 [Naegleria lovaniensis]KAG2381760.1 hypothetical protein C9374_006144 [Naegleria lovaniensis]